MSEINADITLSFNKEFCEVLEYYLSAAFRNSSNKQLEWLWCDGIKMPHFDIQITKNNIRNTKQIITEAFIGTDGQGLYEMVIQLGLGSLKACLNDQNLKDYLPSAESTDWIKIETSTNTIELQLN